MKFFKLFLIAFLTLWYANLDAQTEAGNFLFGGSSKLGFSAVKTKLSSDGESYDYSKTKILNFSPQIGYFVIDGLAIGVEIPVNSQVENVDFMGQKMTSKSFAYAVAPFARYYFGSQNVRPFLHGSAGVGSENYKYEEDGDSDEDKYKIVLFSLGGGVGIFVNDNVSFDCGIFYSSMTRKFDDYMGSNVSVDQITSGFNFSVGFVVAF